MHSLPGNIVRIKDYLPPKPAKQKSQYHRYRLPFFNKKARCAWDVTPTGNYAADCETGRAYAVAFLKSCDASIGWSSLLSNIVADMIRAGTNGTFSDGHPKINGVVVGFMSEIGRALTHLCRPTRGA
jgi:hypothetical protein